MSLFNTGSIDCLAFTPKACSIQFKKSVVEKSGSYGMYKFCQDYHLWARMILQGAKFYNIQESLVRMRVGYSQLTRRTGLRYAFNEFRIQKEFLDMGFINQVEFVRNVLIRFMARLVPKIVLKNIYRILRKNL